MKNKKVCNKTRSLSASLLLKGQGTEHTTVKIMVYSYKSKYTISVKTGTLFTGKVQYSRSCRKPAPGKLKKVVITRGGRIQE